MFGGINAVVKNQFAVFAVKIVEKEFLITHGAAVAHVQNKVVTLALVLDHHVARTVYAHHTGLIEDDSLRGTAISLRNKGAVFTGDDVDSTLSELCHVINLYYTSLGNMLNSKT